MINKLIKKYANFVVNKPKIVLMAVIFITIIAFLSLSTLESTGIEYKDILPENVESVQAINFIGDEFGTTSQSAIIILEIDPIYSKSNEIRDIRDARVLQYSDLLEQKIQRMENIVSINSASNMVKQLNDGYLPKTNSEIIEIMDKDIIIDQSGLDIGFVLSQSATGLGQVQEGLEANINALEGIDQGLSASANGLGDISDAITQIGSGISQMGSATDLSQLTLSINQIILLVDASNATSAEKSQIKAYLEGLKLGINELESGLQQIGTASSEISKSTKQLSQGINSISTSMNDLENAISQLKDLNTNLYEGVGNIKTALERINEYQEIFSETETNGQSIEINQFDSYISDDYTLTIIKIQLADMNDDDKKEFNDELKNIISETTIPPGLKISTTGSVIIFEELKKQIGPTMSTTSIISLIAILIIVILLFTSIRYGLISLLGIGFGIVWAFGFIALMGMGLSPEASGAVSMIMGIGIDFGIQIVNRFKQELRKMNTKKALVKTLTNVIEPMIISTVAIFIGFRAMSLGQLTFLGKLGNMLSIGVLMCFFAAITIIPAILMITEKYKKQ